MTTYEAQPEYQACKMREEEALDLISGQKLAVIRYHQIGKKGEFIESGWAHFRIVNVMEFSAYELVEYGYWKLLAGYPDQDLKSFDEVWKKWHSNMSINVSVNSGVSLFVHFMARANMPEPAISEPERVMNTGE